LIKLSTYGVFFLGTLHQGGEGAVWGRRLADVASIFTHTSDAVLKHLEKDVEWLQQQLQQYAPISKDFVTKFAYETYPTPLALGRTILVSAKVMVTAPTL
jgi:hypothetical protein